MTISSLYGFSFESLYNTGGKAKTVSPETSFFSSDTDKDKSARAANSAGYGAATSGSITSTATANTLWQTQNIAQSAQSQAIDVEEVDTASKAKAPTAAEKFKEFMNKTPEEMMRDSVLKEFGYTEEDMAAMSPEDRAKVEEKIRVRIQEKIEETMREHGVDIDGAKQVAQITKIDALV